MDIGKYEGARVTVTMNNGDEFTTFEPKAKGAPGSPLSFEDVLAKFEGNLEYAEQPIPTENAKRIVELVQSLEELDDIRKISDLIVWE